MSKKKERRKPEETKLKRLMIGYGITRTRLAATTNLSTITIWKLETARSDPTRKNADLIAGVFGVPASEVFDRIYGE